LILDDFQAQGRDWCGGGSSFAGKAVAAGRSGVPGRIGSTSKRRQCPTPFFKKKTRVQHRWFQQFCQRSPATIPTFHVSSFHPSILRQFSEVVASGEAAKAAELVPDIVSWKLGSREGINLVDGMNYMGKSMEHLAFVEIRDYDN